MARELSARYSEAEGCELESDPSLLESNRNLTFFYQLNFVHTAKEWSSRWDAYLQNINDANIRWLSICNSIILVAVLTYLVGRTLRRVLQRDIDAYNSADVENGPGAESGWKRLKADVFRPPTHSLVLTALIGTGIQVTLMRQH